MFEVHKIVQARDEFGDRAVSIHTPAVYGVYVDGRLVGRIDGTVAYMGPTEWRVRYDGYKGKTRAYARTLREAKVKAAKLTW